MFNETAFRQEMEANRKAFEAAADRVCDKLDTLIMLQTTATLEELARYQEELKAIILAGIQVGTQAGNPKVPFTEVGADLVADPAPPADGPGIGVFPPYDAHEPKAPPAPETKPDVAPTAKAPKSAKK